MIYDFLEKYAKKKPTRFHTPGHMGSLCKCDITELTSGEFPCEYIKRAEEFVAGVYRAKAARLLTNGSSLGIKAGLLALDLSAMTFSGYHQAIEEGQKLAKKPLFVHDTEKQKNGLQKIVSLDDIKDAIEKYPAVQTVVLESPDYFGRTVDIEVAKFIKESGKALYIDAAHGAHFPASKGLFDNEIFSLADAYNVSAHKTLNAYTQTAYLLINNASIVPKIDAALKNLGTTSPSFVLLAQLEKAAYELSKSESDYKKLFAKIESFKKEVHCLENNDFTRIVIDAKKNSFNSGKDLANHLHKKNIYPEKIEGNFVVLIITPYSPKNCLQNLLKILWQKNFKTEV